MENISPLIGNTTSENKSPRLAIYARYFQKIKNVGDQYAPVVIENTSGLLARTPQSAEQAHLLSVGSVFAMATPQSVIWGTGLMGPDFDTPQVPADQISALRGKLSANLLIKSGFPLKDIAFGDPGILAAKIINKDIAPVDGRIGFIPHISDRRHPASRAFRKHDNVFFLNVADEPTVFLEKMKTCQYIASSSLHGLIFADALGIPNTWITIGGKLGGGFFKFHDYYSVSLDPKDGPMQLTPTTQPGEVLMRASLSSTAHLISDLTSAFPRQSLDRLGAINPVPEDFVSLNESRNQALPLFAASGLLLPTGEIQQNSVEFSNPKNSQQLKTIFKKIRTFLMEKFAEIPYFHILLGPGELTQSTLDATRLTCDFWMKHRKGFDLLVVETHSASDKLSAPAAFSIDDFLSQLSPDKQYAIATLSSRFRSANPKVCVLHRSA